MGTDWIVWKIQNIQTGVRLRYATVYILRRDGTKTEGVRIDKIIRAEQRRSCENVKTIGAE